MKKTIFSSREEDVKMTRITASWLLTLTIVLGLAAAPALAGPLDDAKRAGQVGEQPNGYVGVLPGAPDSAKALAKDINSRRKERYTEISRKRGTSVEQVGKQAGKKLIGEARKGEYVKKGGKWVQK